MSAGGPVDFRALAAQRETIEAQKELASIQVAQQVRENKAKNAINFILLPLQTADGIIRQDPEGTPESQAARAACYNWLAYYFSTDSDFEKGLPVQEATAFLATAKA